MGYLFIHLKTRLIIPFQWRIPPLSNTWYALTKLLPNKKNNYASKNNYNTKKSKVIENNLLYQRILSEGFNVLIYRLVAKISQV